MPSCRAKLGDLRRSRVRSESGSATASSSRNEPSPATSSRWIRTVSHSSSRRRFSTTTSTPVPAPARRAAPPGRAPARRGSSTPGPRRRPVASRRSGARRRAPPRAASAGPPRRGSRCRAGRSRRWSSAPSASASARVRRDRDRAPSAPRCAAPRSRSEAIACARVTEVTVVDHPLVARHLSVLRDRATPSGEFRRRMREAAMLIGFEALRDLRLAEIDIETPLETTAGAKLGDDIVVIAILRAGLGMVEGFLALMPEARVGHLGMYRDEEALSPGRLLRVDPRPRAGGRDRARRPDARHRRQRRSALRLLKERGAQRLRFVCLVAAPEGLAAVRAEHPEVPIFCAAVDRRARRAGLHPARPRRRRRPPLRHRLAHRAERRHDGHTSATRPARPARSATPSGHSAAAGVGSCGRRARLAAAARRPSGTRRPGYGSPARGELR